MNSIKLDHIGLGLLQDIKSTLSILLSNDIISLQVAYDVIDKEITSKRLEGRQKKRRNERRKVNTPEKKKAFDERRKKEREDRKFLEKIRSSKIRCPEDRCHKPMVIEPVNVSKCTRVPGHPEYKFVLICSNSNCMRTIYLSNNLSEINQEFIHRLARKEKLDGGNNE